MRLAVRGAPLTLPRLFRARLAWWLAVGVAVVVLAGVSALLLTGGTGATPKTVASTVAPVRRGTVVVTASAAGTVQASATRGLSFSVAGTVTELDVKAGDPVTAGQVLAKIDDSDAQSQLASAQDTLASAQNALAAAQLAASPTPSATGCAAPAAYTAGTAGYYLAGNYSQSPSPSASPSPSPSPSHSPTPRPTASRTSSTGPGTGAGACRTAGTGGAGGGGTGGGGRGAGGDALFSAQQQVNNAQLALAQAQRRVAGTVITAPVAGRVLSVAGAVGSAENPGGTGFIVLGGVSDTEVTALFTETDVAHLAVGQPATITLPDNPGTPLTGKVSQVSPAGTVSGRLVRYPVMIAFDQVPANLLYGQSANVVITTQSVSNVLYVSSSAVSPGPDGSATVTVRSGGQDQTRAVQTGLRGDQYTEIRSGLSEGESVVTGGR